MKDFGKKRMEIIIGAIIVLAIIICVICFLGKGKDKNNNENNANTNPPVEDKVFTEQDIIDAYGMSKEDAINLVKSLFNSDNFDFDAEVSKTAKYIVTVTNTINDSTYTYEVDPISKSYYEVE